MTTINTVNLTRDQALLNTVAAQRDEANNRVANLAADLDIARAANDVQAKRIAELEAEVAEKALVDGFNGERSAVVNP